MGHKLRLASVINVGDVMTRITHLPNSAFNIVWPILRSIPALLVRIPVFLEICCFTLVIPRALFHEKVSPEIPVFDF